MVEPKISQKIGAKDSAVIGGAVHSIYGSLIDGDWEAAAETADIAIEELEEFAPVKEISVSAPAEKPKNRRRG